MRYKIVGENITHVCIAIYNFQDIFMNMILADDH